MTFSPCIAMCHIRNGVCMGCGRTMDEIREWPVASDARKQDILDRIYDETEAEAETYA